MSQVLLFYDVFSCFTSSKTKRSNSKLRISTCQIVSLVCGLKLQKGPTEVIFLFCALGGDVMA